ncbi:cupin domain-containing protein [Bradyrhizobium sp. ISRA435]|nr:cupin domain-containing protein [Bradyrhizobium sp. ISRA435]
MKLSGSWPFICPTGKPAPWHSARWEQYFLLLDGALEVGLGPSPDKMKHVHMEPGDLLYFPVGIGFDYRNIANDGTTVIVIGGKVNGAWPTETTYLFPGEDKPFSRPW